MLFLLPCPSGWAFNDFVMKPFSLLAVAVTFIAAQSALSAGVNYHLLQTIPVGGDGEWDYLSVDSAAQRLYVSHGSKVVVIDLAKSTRDIRITSAENTTRVRVRLPSAGGVP